MANASASEDDGSTSSSNGATLLLLAIASGAVLGGLVGWLWPGVGSQLTIVGDLWLRALRALVVPLIVTSVILAMTEIGDLRRLGRLGGWTLGVYLFTSTAAGTLGLVAVRLIEPGVGVDISSADAPAEAASASSWQDIVLGLVPTNLVEAAANTDLLPLIVFSVAFGAILAMLPGRRALVDPLEILLEVVMKMVHLVMLAAPVGVLALIAGRFGEAGGGEAIVDLLRGIGLLVVVVIGGLLVHAVVVLPTLLAVLGRRRPLPYVRGTTTALVTAFATASSAATLPVSTDCVEQLGVSRRARQLVLPLGATVNMDGSALYEAVAALFIAQAWGIDLSLGDQIVVCITAVLASIGAAGIPEAGLVTMVIVLDAVGLPLQGIGLLLAIDWLLDRFRTAVNVWGDCVTAAIVDHQTADDDSSPDDTG